jgi:hypothetical protein
MGVPAGPSGSGAVGSLGNPALNYAIQKYQGDPANHPALAYLAHELADPKFNVPWSGSGAPYPDLRDSTDPQLAGVRAQAAAILADAQANSGPYRTQPLLNLAPDGRTGTVTATELISAAGNKLTGFTAHAVLAGPAVWTGTTSQTVNLNAGDQLGFTATGNGRVSVTLTIDAPGVAATTYSVPGFQNLMVAAGAQPVSGQSGDVQMVFDFQPVATSTAPTYVEAGQDLSDVLHVATSDGLDWPGTANGPIPATFKVSWYYSPVLLPAGKTVPAGATLYTTGTGTATGAGDLTVTGAKKTAAPGYYYPVASFTKADQPAGLQKYFTGDWAAGFNDPNEQSLQKWAPAVSTKISFGTNGQICDEITVTGNNPVQALTVASTLYLTNQGTIAAGTDTVPADAKVLGTMSTTVTGNETKSNCVTLSPSQLVDLWANGYDKANTYFQETIAATGTTTPWKGKHLLPSETQPLNKPAISTQASPNGTVPLAAHDTGVVTGYVPSGPGISVSSTTSLYQFGDSVDGSAQAYCTKSYWDSPAVTITKAGSFDYPGTTIKNVGTYGWQETLSLTYTENGTSKTVVLDKGACGEASETVIAFPEAVTVTPDKPVLMVNTGFAPTRGTPQETGPNMPLLIAGGSTLAVALLAGAGLFYRKRFANRAAEPGTVHADELTD